MTPTKLFGTLRWSFGVIWSTNRGLTLAFAACMVVRGLVPAGLALAARGLVNAATASAAGPRTLAPLVPWLVAGLVCTLGEALGQTLNRFLVRRLNDDLHVRTTVDVLEHAASLDLAFFESRRGRKLLARASAEPAARLSTLLAESEATITEAVRAVSLLAVLAWIEPLVPIVVGPVALPFLFFQRRLATWRYSEDRKRTMRQQWARYYIGLLTGVGSVPEVKLLGIAQRFVRRCRDLMREFRDADRRFHWQNLVGSSAAATVVIGALYVLLVRVALRVLDGSVGIGDLAVFGTATARMRTVLEAAIRVASATYEHSLYVTSLREFLDEPAPPPPPEIAGLPAAHGAVELRDVTFTYPGASTPALEQVSVRVEPGETLAIVGENGAGKSTIVKLLAGLYEPQEGAVLLDGVDLRRLSAAEHRRRSAFVLQGFGRYEASVGENIEYGVEDGTAVDPARVVAAAEAAGIHPAIMKLPEGYDTRVGRMFGEHDLSGGQWQLVAIARAFARQAPLVVLDEPTASLDARAEFELFRRFKELARGRTTILISHRFSTVSMADRIVVIGGGRVAEIGTHDDLLARGGVYAALYGFHEQRLPGASHTRAAS
jgi:ATP-binding cassette subfamily B protein